MPRPLKLDTYATGMMQGPLVGTRYGMPEMSALMDERRATARYMLEIEGTVPLVISGLYPNVVPPEHAQRIRDVAGCQRQGIDEFLSRVAEREAVTHHLEDSIFEMIRQDAGDEARRYVHMFLTSADSSETAKGLLLRDGLKLLIKRTEELRDTCVSAARDWAKKGYVHMASTHGADALPEVLGRRLATEAYMLDDNASRLDHDLRMHVVGKLSGATGNYHAMKANGVNGPLIERECCNTWKIRPVVSLQDPPREHLAYIMADIAVSGRTAANILRWIKSLKSTAIGELREEPDEGQEGSSAMPHKIGNPFVEERGTGFSYLLGSNFSAVLESTARVDSRNLEGSALDRIVIPQSFIALDYAMALAANVLQRVEPQPENIKTGMARTFGATTSERVRYQLIMKGMPERQARELSGKLARRAMKEKVPYSAVLLTDRNVMEYLSGQEVAELAAPENYTGESKAIVERAYDELFGKRFR